MSKPDLDISARNVFQLLLAGALSAAAAGEAQGATVTWTGGAGNSSWSSPANWSSNPLLPGQSDDVIINTFNVELDVDSPFQVRSVASNANLYIWPSGSLAIAESSQTRGLYMYGGTVSGGGDLRITGASSFASGIISGSGTLFLAPGATMYSNQSTPTFARNVTIDGTLAFVAGNGSHSVSLGGITMTISRTGVLSFDLSGNSDATFTVAGATGANSTISNLGTIIKSGTGRLDIGSSSSLVGSVTLSNTGLFDVRGGTASIRNAHPVQFDGSTLTAGHWRTFSTGNFTVPTGVHTIGANAWVEIAGGGIGVLYSGIDRVDGRLSFSGGTNFCCYPGPGPLVNNGILEVGPGSTLSLIRQYIQAATGNLTIGINGTSPATEVGRITSTVGAILDGTLNIEFANGYEPGAGDSFEFINTSPVQVTGAFAATHIPPVDALVHVVYAPSTVSLDISCVGDFNFDGGIDGDDVAAFFTAWEGGQLPADVNQDGGIDGRDVQVFFAHWETGC